MLDIIQERIDFVIAGVQKGGTTSLDAYLRQHPLVSMARKKEVHFFDKKAPTGWAPLDHAIYNSNFDWPRLSEAQRYGEATPIYMWWQGALERLWAYNPDIKLIILLRDPVERAWSQYRMDMRLQRENMSFREAIESEHVRCRRSLPYQDRERSLLDRGFYAPQIRRIQRIFDPSQVLYLKSERFQRDTERVLDEVCAFLDITPSHFNVSKQFNAASDDKTLQSSDRRFLQSIYQHDAQEVRRILGWKCSEWCV